MATAPLVDPHISVAHGGGLTFTLSAKGGVAPWTWLDHPAGSVGYFVDAVTGVPSNVFYLVPGMDRTGASCLPAGLVVVGAEVVPVADSVVCVQRSGVEERAGSR